MYCPQCGTQNADGAAFCGNCGAKLTSPVSPAATQSATAPNPQPASPNPEVNPIASTAFSSTAARVRVDDDTPIGNMRKLIISPLCLVGVVSFVLMLIIKIAQSQSVGLQLISSINSLWDYVGIDDTLGELTGILYQFNALSGFFTVLTLLPQIIIAIGLCMTVYAAFDRKNAKLSSSGMKVVKIMCQISFIASVVLSALIALLLLIFIGVQAASDEPSSMGVIVVLYIVLLAIFIFVTCYRKAILDTASAGFNLIEERAPVNPSRFVAVMCFITCGLNVISAFAGGLPDWLAAAADLCFGLLIYRFIPIARQSYDSRMLLGNDSSAVSDASASPDSSVDVNVQGTLSQTTVQTKKSNLLPAVIGIAVSVVAIVICVLSATAPGVDKQLVGTWALESNPESTIVFKRNGKVITNPTVPEYTEYGTYTTDNGVITFVDADGSANELRYRIVDQNEIRIENEYIDTHSWESYTRWDTFYRVD